MPQIIPIRDLKNTTTISQICHEVDEPVFVTKNGYGDLVIMSIECYDKSLALGDVYAKLNAAEAQVSNGQTLNARDSLKKIREKYNV